MPRLAIPLPVARTVAGAAERAFGLVGRTSPLTRSAIDKYVEDSAVDASRIQRELGFVPETDLVQGWRLTIATMREQGALPAGLKGIGA